MERFLIILISAAIGSGFFIWFSSEIKKSAMKQFIMSHLWLLHPNAICYWRTGMAWLGFVLYFFFALQAVGIFIFTFAAILDGVDGVVAREFNMVTSWGESLDPMCDKLTYLPPLIGFAYTGDILSAHLIWILTGIEIIGQFLARNLLNRLKFSLAANNFGKIKAMLCFSLVILCALMEKNPGMIDIADEVLITCIILASASIVFKFVPNWLYADILSFLNFSCGVVSMIMAHQHYFAWAVSIIIAGQLFDLFDGRMAQKHGGTKYGPIMDDIADFVSFGLAPAYIIIQKIPYWGFILSLIFTIGVGFRLIRFIAKDKKRSDLPPKVFNGLPSPAGALIVLGASLVAHPVILSILTLVSIGLMVSHIRFIHLGRMVLNNVPKPLFFLISAATVVTLAFIIKTRSVQMFGYLILSSVIGYIIYCRYTEKFFRQED